ncbi:glycoside hydrolase family 30 protein [Fundicoccus sp. Sow4_H7]|uniref:glycoside hydrolase family 30 protein n=1 Tax=Fundicoccus sp. Sow4_H7 TaxID=3438784 RepID=UPI003F93CC7E
MRKQLLLIIPLLFVLIGMSLTKTNNIEVLGTDMNEKIETVTIDIDISEEHQTIESFGASGAWWSQDVGGWTDMENDSLSKREYIAQLLFDPTDGIGLSSYRYNLGAGSTLENSPKIEDPWRRAESFESAPGVYDWTNDQNSMWFLKQAVAYGIDDIYLFVNSPLTRLTESGAAYGETDASGKNKINLLPENYQVFADYVLDVTEYFLEDGIPVTHISPINEPQWEWTGGQEGIHYEPEEVVNILEVFVDEMEKRSSLSDVSLSMPELGEWANSSTAYFNRLIESEKLMDSIDTWDIHSYWSDNLAKLNFIDWMEENEVEVSLKMTEWTEMVNGRDYTMNSALTLANEIYEDLTTLDVEAWQYWIAVSSYDYRDGLIYVELDDQTITPTKRLWTMGNFSKYIKPGYVRVSTSSSNKALDSVSFIGEGDNGEELITVIINQSYFDKFVSLDGLDYTNQISFITNVDHDLEEQEITDNQQILIPRQSVVTIKSFN